MSATNQQDLKPVRVVFRQLDYLTTVTDPLGNEVDGIKTAYGPNHPMLDVRRYPELDPDSQEFADMVSDFRYGQVIGLRPHQYVGLIKSGAVRDVKVDPDTGQEEDTEEELLDVNEATVDELADWIRNNDPKPTVNDVVQASGGDANVARKLLEAESQATNGEPRKGVLEGLSAVISRGDTGDDEG
jgi:hypothetical protein